MAPQKIEQNYEICNARIPCGSKQNLRNRTCYGRLRVMFLETNTCINNERLMKFAAAYPEMFAALVPVCGGIDINDAPKLAHIPIWATHTDNDSIVPVSTSVNMMKAISLAGSQDNKLTVFEPYRFRYIS